VTVALFASAVFSHDLPAASLSAIREIFSALPEGLVIVNRKRHVTFANPAAVALLGAQDPAIEGYDMERVLRAAPLPDLTRDALIDGLKQVMSGERNRAIVGIEYKSPAPRVVTVLVAAADANGGRRAGPSPRPLAAADRFVFLSFHDDTESRARQLMLSRANEVKDLFITMIGHDLKAPLNAITGYSELIGLDAQASADALAVYRYSQQILDSARQIQLMMENARIFSRLVDPQDILRAREAVDLSALVEKEISNLRSSAERRTITVQFAREGGEGPAEVFAAPILRSVFQNVVDNAIKYSPEKSKVRVVLRQLAGEVEVDVIDEGPGIPGDKRDAIFQKFTRLDQTRTRTDGLGLGLAISRQIVELHGGSLTAHARPDGKSGALFRVRIPRGTPAAS